MRGKAAAMIGTSEVWRRVTAYIERAAATDATVLIQGETGTGKDLLARAIHERSARVRSPFVRVDCAALPAGLVESELFGHAKGAFTGALARRAGRIELASDGTVFLDEIGELPLESQPKLLRLLQEREYEAVGSKRIQHANIRVVAATNVDLKKAVQQGRFRADLFYRLAALCLDVPPLRSRPEDIHPLAVHFLKQQAMALDRPMFGIDAQASATLSAYHWPGNVRELKNAVERACILADAPVLTARDFILDSVAPTPVDTLGRMPGPIVALREVERRHIQEALHACAGIVEGKRGAAAALGLPASTLRFRARRLGIAIGRHTAGVHAPALSSPEVEEDPVVTPNASSHLS
jgi:transcriptional regulator with GAF, ATPase, and Fis domain